MLTFLQETLLAIKKDHKDLSTITFILPSKRAGGFLKNLLRTTATETYFAPKIISIEEFIEELSGLEIIDSTELLFKSYQAYLHTDAIQEKEDFETYASWATTLLADFNEIDRFLVDPKPFFNYLSNIQDINHWYVKDQKTELIENYLKFWNSLNEFYDRLKTSLLNESIGYQGMVYRKAVEDIEYYRNAHNSKIHIFIGFNALNKAEQHIFQELLELEHNKVYWDTDAYLYNDQQHSASVFLRNYHREWKYFQSHPLEIIADNFQKEKNIQIIEVQKNIGQAKYVGEILSEYTSEDLDNTAIVLADEQLLIPILYSLPKNITTVNITMGVGLKTFPTATFFELLLNFHLHSGQSHYYKDVLALLNHPTMQSLLTDARSVSEKINTQNLSNITVQNLVELLDDSKNGLVQLIFGDWANNSKIALKNCTELIYKLRDANSDNMVDRTVIHHLYAIFNRITALNERYSHLKTVRTVHSLFTDLILHTTLDFKGDAYSGLQIMGILETRVLDFKNVIVTSVNEGIIPAGKSNASFITFDLKQQFGLPQFSEKDAIYTYHFYHLLHRSQNIHLLYSNHSDGLNAGEKSRFILQLEIDKLPNHKIDKIVLSPEVTLSTSVLKTVAKTDSLMLRLREIAQKGFSPSALTSYIRNPLDFYFQKILRIKEFEEVEETVAANTLGTIVHDTLENFYKPLEGSFLSSEKLSDMKQHIDTEVRLQFKRTFKGGDFSKGKNLIVFEVAKRYITNFINFELGELKAGNKIKIISVEQNLKVEIQIPELDFPVHIGGKVDRVDEYNGQLRIVDYKTGRVEQGHLEIMDWEEISLDYKYSKVIQVLAYALMMNDKSPIDQAEAGIISFKNLNAGFLKFAEKLEVRGQKNSLVSQETLGLYLVELKKLIMEICDPTIPFIEKEV
ncbi:PD-(D/E)XK nuclease family protein [Ulvibacter antarcticus]|uniref:PD-(D/E)XK nuclease superfamily protein n=1 Tax=Ulvibacter antarcticus TaxID=442714 RepID=A0A3L9YZM4_9FLAO|nr:PD-(D/E)XK nuclease family protein [Ulvibacter antarcticus]RMA66086.1 PD-(D/E)XK nuclease superfamily protein [Ulvibacter antarcticus]